jgi:hypothetical protein
LKLAVIILAAQTVTQDRFSLFRTSPKVLRMPYHANSIDAQQQSIASSLKDTYNRFEVINAKLKKFKTTSLKSSAALKVTKWLKERNDIDKCEQKLLNQAKSILKKIECGLNINRPFVEDDFDTFRRFSKTLSRRVKQTKHSTSKVESLRTELAVLEKALGDRQVQCTTELEQVRSKLKIHQYGNEGDSLPSEIVKALDDFRIEFDFILSERYVQGLGRALEVDIHTLSSSLQSNFRKIALSLSQHYNKEAHNVKVNSRNDNDNGWDERCQLILRSAFQQWSTHRNVKEKKACIRKIMEATGMPLIRCKEEWHELEILTISKNSEKVSRNAVKKAYDKTLRLGLEDISKMRHDTICNLAKITEVELNGELALEREYRLQLLRSLQRQIEDRQDEEARHMSKLEREEKLQLKNKRKSELSSQREKLRLHLESKHKEIYLSRLEDLRRENDEKEARLKRIKINKERCVKDLIEDIMGVSF